MSSRTVSPLSIIRLLLPKSLKSSYDRDIKVRSAISFRFFYVFTLHTPLLVPFLVEITGDQSASMIMLAIGIASAAMTAAEVPSGYFADRYGTKRALMVGAGAMIGAMFGFFILSIFGALRASEASGVWIEGIYCIVALEILVGIALAFVSGADTVVYLDALKDSNLTLQLRKAAEGVGSALRYYGTMIAVGVGALYYSIANVIPLGREAKILMISLAFLGTAAFQLLALKFLRALPKRLEEKRICSAKEIARTAVQVFSSTGFALLFWIGCLTVAVSIFCSYYLQVPIKRGLDQLEEMSWAFVPGYAIIMIVGYMLAAKGSSAFATVCRLTHLTTSKGLALAIFMFLCVMSALSVFAFLSEGAVGPGWLVLGFASIVFCLSQASRGFCEPFCRTSILDYTAAYGSSFRTSMISIFGASTRVAHFLVASVFSAIGLSDLVGRPLSLTVLFILVAMPLISVVVMGMAFSLKKWQLLGRRSVVVVIGSFREGIDGLLGFSSKLRSAGFIVAHPYEDAKVTGEESGFVKLSTDPYDDPERVQRNVFHLIDYADFVVAYTPTGRIGNSASLEIGYAIRSGKPVYRTHEINDLTINELTKNWAMGKPDSGS